MMKPLRTLGAALRAERRLFGQVVAVEVAAGSTTVLAAVLGVRAGAAVAVSDPTAVALVHALALVVLLVGVFAWADMWLAHVLAYRVIDRVRAGVHRALRRLAPRGLGRRRSGEVAATAMSDAEALEWFYAHTVAQWCASAVVGVLAALAAFTWLGPLAMVVVAGQLLLVAVPLATAGLAARQGSRLRRAVAAVSAIAVEARHSAREIALLGLLGTHRNQMRAGTERVQLARRRIAVRVAVEQAATELVAVLTVITVLVGCSRQVAVGKLAPVDLPAATALAGACLVPVVLAVGGLSRLGEMSAAAGRIVEVLKAVPSVRNAPPAAGFGSRLPAPAGGNPVGERVGDGVAAASPRGRIDVQDVVVRYPDTDADVLRGLSTTIAAGESVAIVGASGAGKTTLVHTLTRLFDTDEGRVLLDGRDIALDPPSCTRARVFLVEQQPYVFRLSIRDNLDLPGRGVDDDVMWRALADVGLLDHVRTLPGGLDELIAEAGASWSGGQRQRLGIARGLIADPDVLILDEPTAAVDSLTEQDLLATLAARRRGRTTLIVSHRPSTIAGCARVLFLHDGRIRATGTHEHLLRTEPRYGAVLQARDRSQPNPKPRKGGDLRADDPAGDCA